MAYEIKDNTGSLFKNDRKASDTHPDYNGSAKIAGVEYWISAWLKEGKDGGKKFFSFSFKPKESQKADMAAQADRNFDQSRSVADTDFPF